MKKKIFTLTAITALLSVIILMVIFVIDTKAVKFIEPEDTSIETIVTQVVETVDSTPETEIITEAITEEPVISETKDLETNLNQYIALYTQEDVIAVARTIEGEAGSYWIPTSQKAAVAWCILNRYDRGGYASIAAVCSAPNQFHGYWNIINPRQDMIDLAIDVLERWSAEQQGCVYVGRTLPEDYLYFWGDGKYNYFRVGYRDQYYWDWSYPDPYEK